VKLTPRGEVCQRRVKYSPRGEHPLFAPLFFLTIDSVHPRGWMKGWTIPLGDKFYPWGPTLVVKIGLCPRANVVVVVPKCSGRKISPKFKVFYKT
jgi:hypothetical protein